MIKKEKEDSVNNVAFLMVLKIPICLDFAYFFFLISEINICLV